MSNALTMLAREPVAVVDNTIHTISKQRGAQAVLIGDRAYGMHPVCSVDNWEQLCDRKLGFASIDDCSLETFLKVDVAKALSHDPLALRTIATPLLSEFLKDPVFMDRFGVHGLNGSNPYSIGARVGQIEEVVAQYVQQRSDLVFVEEQKSYMVIPRQKGFCLHYRIDPFIMSAARCHRYIDEITLQVQVHDSQGQLIIEGEPRAQIKGKHPFIHDSGKICLGSLDWNKHLPGFSFGNPIPYSGADRQRASNLLRTLVLQTRTLLETGYHGKRMRPVRYLHRCGIHAGRTMYHVHKFAKTKGVDRIMVN